MWAMGGVPPVAAALQLLSPCYVPMLVPNGRRYFDPVHRSRSQRHPIAFELRASAVCRSLVVAERGGSRHGCRGSGQRTRYTSLCGKRAHAPVSWRLQNSCRCGRRQRCLRVPWRRAVQMAPDAPRQEWRPCVSPKHRRSRLNPA